MECNVGGKDRIVRFVAGVVIAALGYFVLSGALTIIAYVIAAILLITAIIITMYWYTILTIKFMTIKNNITNCMNLVEADQFLGRYLEHQWDEDDRSLNEVLENLVVLYKVNKT